MLLGLAGLDLVLVALVLPPLLLGLALFAAALRATAARQREVILADERVAEATGALTGGLRDVVTCGAEDRVGATAGAHVDDAARATLSLARLTAVRTAALGMSGWVPLLLIVVAAPWLIRNGVTAGAILGAVTCHVLALPRPGRPLGRGRRVPGRRCPVFAADGRGGGTGRDGRRAANDRGAHLGARANVP